MKFLWFVIIRDGFTFLIWSVSPNWFRNYGGFTLGCFVSDIAVFVLKRDVKLQLTHSP